MTDPSPTPIEKTYWFVRPNEVQSVMNLTADELKKLATDNPPPEDYTSDGENNPFIVGDAVLADEPTDHLPSAFFRETVAFTSEPLDDRVLDDLVEDEMLQRDEEQTLIGGDAVLTDEPFYEEEVEGD